MACTSAQPSIWSVAIRCQSNFPSKVQQLTQRHVTIFCLHYYFIQIFLVVPPEIVQRPRDVDVVANQRVELECQASGEPFPVITWERNGTQFAGVIPLTIPKF